MFQITFATAALHQSISIFKEEEGGMAQPVGSCLVSEKFDVSLVEERDSSSLYLPCTITCTHYLHSATKLHLESTYPGRRILLNAQLTTWGIVLLN